MQVQIQIHKYKYTCTFANTNTNAISNTSTNTNTSPNTYAGTNTNIVIMVSWLESEIGSESVRVDNSKNRHAQQPAWQFEVGMVRRSAFLLGASEETKTNAHRNTDAN